MKLLSWNVNGLRAICDKNALDWIAQEQIDFIGFQEIKAHEDKFPKKIY
ncbi:endonuclease/exonuclease/phosphatase family protein, partial [Campylobacter jejuni]|nr:endonuclease/exonuclease/phosphatase family protein [Campylobacter jejuni]